jgi:hypothetical protein
MRKIYQPEIYQGRDKRRSYFEGWYLKHVSADQLSRLVVISGISRSAEDPHTFIQIITGTPAKAYYIRYDIDSFLASEDSFDVTIGNNHFSLDGIHLDIENDELSLSADIHYGDITEIDRSFLSPNIMGFFAYFKFLQCFHGVISLNHSLQGAMVLNGITHRFKSGKGYIEKDWGTSFPKQYIWLQCNHFEEDINLFGSIAHIPFLGTSFLGFIAVFSFEGKQYRFATYNGAKYTFERLSDKTIKIIFLRRNFRLEIIATLENGTVLKAPKQGVMTDEISETLDGTLDISFWQNQTCLITATGSSAAIEIVSFP